ncbi:MAG: class II glutamine amidotransferase [Bacteroidetes bacterium]|nr:class II glutamine amidotransferase [Bacteroidota bacterium]MBK9800787.1 class II glutamine amidotransferase [Bacteroidota bacterium]
MSDSIKHECGIALIRLRKPLNYYSDKYGTALYGLNKLYLLMEKQHNRGQDGAGVANIKLDTEPGSRYISRYRSNGSNAIKEIFEKINNRLAEAKQSNPVNFNDAEWLKKNVAFSGELLLGHLRYGTFGKNSIENCHPFLRQNNWKTKNLVVAGNFNLTNVDELFEQLVDLGQHPKEKTDTVTVMERIGHFLDVENERLFQEFKKQGHDNQTISTLIGEHLDLQKILIDASRKWDGGYAMAGLIGHGDAFVLRDPNGIRPAYYYYDDEIAVVTSERPAIQTAFNVSADKINEIKPGHAVIIRKNGSVEEIEIRKSETRNACSFERIYFSRGSDAAIYQERKKLGTSLCPAILQAIENDTRNTVFSYIPNTAEIAFYGMVKGIEDYLTSVKQRKIMESAATLDEAKLSKILSIHPRIEKLAIKDAKLRTFITDDMHRDEMVAHVYDVTYGVVKPTDTLVVIDDSIVRGTTLKQSILRMLDRLNPKKIIIVSSAPQIRYPDCYGIDMAKLGDFIAFQAAIQLLKENFKENIIEEVYEKAKAMDELPKDKIRNVVKDIYAPFTPNQISKKIAELLTPPDLSAEVEVIYQSLEGLHAACTNNSGDWYFSGNYPTPGGNKVANKAFINYMEGKNIRAY